MRAPKLDAKCKFKKKHESTLLEEKKKKKSTDQLFNRQLGEISESVALVLMVDFNFPDMTWEYNTAVTSRSWKFLQFA